MPFIFQAIRMHQYWSVDAVRDLLALRSIHPFIRSFVFRPEINMKDRECILEQSASDSLPESMSRCASLLAALLTSLYNLEVLCFVPFIMNHRRRAVALDIICSSAPALANVRTLRIPNDAVFLWCGCPAVDAIAIPSPTGVRAWPQSPLVKKLAIGDIQRDLEKELPLIRAIQERMPHLQSLTIENGHFNAEALLDGLRGSRLQLVTLALPELLDLQVGYNPPQCGFGWSNLRPPQREALQQAKKLGLNRVKAAAIRAFPRLKYLWIGQLLVFDFTGLAHSKPSGDGPEDPTSTTHPVRGDSTAAGVSMGEDLDRLEPIYVPYRLSTLDYISDPACLRFTVSV
ncbi:hypothetical protein AURDEDRAFT_170809 [Auricularia subglabra TFB-10046 SS5]|nr:hypothetical protein AURDEDRAFT_170809 [Auricularia subglabra TFB-10046 SS5]